MQRVQDALKVTVHIPLPDWSAVTSHKDDITVALEEASAGSLRESGSARLGSERAESGAADKCC